MHALAAYSLYLFFILCASGMLLSVIARRRAPVVIATVGTACSMLMMVASATELLTGRSMEASLWVLHGLGPLTIRLDFLSSIFLFTAAIVYLSSSLFVKNFIDHALDGNYPADRFGVMYFALLASIVLILVAGDAILFLIGWECMSILCFLLLNHEQRRRSDTSAAYIMLAMSEAGFVAVVLAFLILGRTASSFSFAALAASAPKLSHGGIWGVFVLGFLGFGVKAGLAPVNFWLPRSYTVAPSTFIPVFAGVTLNLGFYGILRLNGDIAPGGYGTGVFALVVGSITALVGILYATTESDLKTMLAHSSIENAGIITAGVGAFLVYRGLGHPVAAAIALTAALYHMVNHSTYKALLFEGTAYVESETGTRDMDKLGGLSRLLPALAAIFLVGCLAIAAVPPFNGFVSEWLTLQSLLRSAIVSSPSVRIVFALCGAGLALTAALAVTCFVKVFAMTFLGLRRGEWELNRERRKNKYFPLAILATVCLLLGLLPTYVIPVLNRAVEPLSGASVSASLVPPFFSATAKNEQLPPAFLQDFHNLGAQSGRRFLPGRGLVVLLRGAEENPVVFAMSPAYSFAALAIMLTLAWFVVTRLTRQRKMERRELWAGGIPKLLPEMSYTATGFSNPVRVVFQAVFRPNIREDTRQTVAVHFRTAIRRRRDETYLVDRMFFRPIGKAMTAIAAFLAGMHHGRLNTYIFYVLGFLLVVLFIYRVS